MATRWFIFLILGVMLLTAGYVMQQVEAGLGLWSVTSYALAAVSLAVYVYRNRSELLLLFSLRSARYGAVSVFTILVFIGILVLVALFSEKRNHRWDLTRSKTHSLALQSRQVLERLDRDTLDLQVYVFHRGQNDLRSKQPLIDLLETYAYHSRRFRHERVDIDRNPLLAMELGITSTSTIILRYGERTEQVYSEQEARITNAIANLLGGDRPGLRGPVYFTVGHGEPGDDAGDPYSISRARESIEQEIGPVRDVLLTTGQGVPDSCDILVVAGPERDFLPQELEAIDRFLARGGRALFLLEPFMADSLAAHLGRYGVRVGDDIVIDLMRGSVSSPFAFLVKDYPTHDITRFFDVGTVFDMARSVSPDSNLASGVTVNVFLETSERSWAESDRQLLQTRFDLVARQAVDQGRKVPIGATVTLEPSFFEESESESADSEAISPRQARLVVIGDRDFVTGSYLGQLGNRDLLLNCLRWLRGQTDEITIQPRETENTPLILERSDMLVMGVTVLAGLPALIIFSGLFVWLRRRSRR